jgi:hypothetical protein
MKNKHSTKPVAARVSFPKSIGILRKQYADLLRLRKEVRQLESARNNNCDFTSDLKSGRSAPGRPSIIV